jgi:hypothetical protein
MNKCGFGAKVKIVKENENYFGIFYFQSGIF